MNYWPVENGKITSAFGNRLAPTKGASSFHDGVDISLPIGTSVMATINGIVSSAGFSHARGNYIEVTSGSTKTAFSHLSDIFAGIGDSVQAGQRIALSGNTGITTGPHLHYSVYEEGKAINPLQFNGAPGEAFSVDGITEKFTNIAINNWGLIIGGLLVFGLIGGRKRRE